MINNVPPLFGMYKEQWIENTTQLRDTLEKWDQFQLKQWLQMMESLHFYNYLENILTFNYEECIELINQFQPNYINSLPNNMSQQCNTLRHMLQRNQSQYNIVTDYLQLLRTLQKSLSSIYVSNNLINAIRNLELYLSSPLNQNTIKPPECTCALI